MLEVRRNSRNRSVFLITLISLLFISTLQPTSAEVQRDRSLEICLVGAGDIPIGGSIRINLEPVNIKGVLLRAESYLLGTDRRGCASARIRNGPGKIVADTLTYQNWHAPLLTSPSTSVELGATETSKILNVETPTRAPYSGQVEVRTPNGRLFVFPTDDGQLLLKQKSFLELDYVPMACDFSGNWATASQPQESRQIQGLRAHFFSRGNVSALVNHSPWLNVFFEAEGKYQWMVMVPIKSLGNGKFEYYFGSQPVCTGENSRRFGIKVGLRLATKTVWTNVVDIYGESSMTLSENLMYIDRTSISAKKVKKGTKVTVVGYLHKPNGAALTGYSAQVVSYDSATAKTKSCKPLLRAKSDSRGKVTFVLCPTAKTPVRIVGVDLVPAHVGTVFVSR